MIIDAHQHAFWQGRDDAGLVADMDRQGIDQAWLLTWLIAPEEDVPYNHGVLNPAHVRADGTHEGIPLSDGLAARARFPERFLLGFCPHPGWANAPALLEAACRLHGVRVCGEWKARMPLDDPRCVNLFRQAGRLGCPVILHLQPPYLKDPKTGQRNYQAEWYGGAIDNLRRALEACPETNFIGHAQGFWREISGAADEEPALYPPGPIIPGGRLQTLLDDHPNLYADLSAGSGLNALRRDPAHAREFLIRYSQRLLFGRDQHGGDLQDFLATLDLPENVRAAIFCGNARRFVPQSGGT